MSGFWDRMECDPHTYRHTHSSTVLLTDLVKMWSTIPIVAASAGTKLPM